MLVKLLATIPDTYQVYVSDNGGFTEVDTLEARHNTVIEKTDAVIPMFANWNRAMYGPQTDYIVIPSDDDLYLENAFAIIEGEIRKNPEADLFVFGHNNIDENNNILSSWTPLKYQTYDAPYGFDVFRLGVDARMPSIVFKKSLLDRIGYFDEHFLMTAADSDLIQRSLLLGKSVFVPRLVSCYRVWNKGFTAQTNTSDNWLNEVGRWTEKIAALAETELLKVGTAFNKQQFVDEIYARNLMSGAANKIKFEGGLSARRYVFSHSFPHKATLLTKLKLLKLIIKSFLG